LDSRGQRKDEGGWIGNTAPTAWLQKTLISIPYAATFSSSCVNTYMTVYSVRGSRHCNEIMWVLGAVAL
jgi:hypothetical protein